MHAFNLRFGPAKTLKERQTYHKLFQILDEARDQVLAQAKVADGACNEIGREPCDGFLPKPPIAPRPGARALFPPELRENPK